MNSHQIVSINQTKSIEESLKLIHKYNYKYIDFTNHGTAKTFFLQANNDAVEAASIFINIFHEKKWKNSNEKILAICSEHSDNEDFNIIKRNILTREEVITGLLKFSASEVISFSENDIKYCRKLFSELLDLVSFEETYVLPEYKDTPKIKVNNQMQNPSVLASQLLNHKKEVKCLDGSTVILDKVVAHLKPFDLTRAGRVSPFWNNIASKRNIWGAELKRNFKYEHFNANANLKNIYKHFYNSQLARGFSISSKGTIMMCKLMNVARIDFLPLLANKLTPELDENLKKAYLDSAMVFGNIPLLSTMVSELKVDNEILNKIKVFQNEIKIDEEFIENNCMNHFYFETALVKGRIDLARSMIAKKNEACEKKLAVTGYLISDVLYFQQFELAKELMSGNYLQDLSDCSEDIFCNVKDKQFLIWLKEFKPFKLNFENLYSFSFESNPCLLMLLPLLSTRRREVSAKQAFHAVAKTGNLHALKSLYDDQPWFLSGELTEFFISSRVKAKHYDIVEWVFTMLNQASKSSTINLEEKENHLLNITDSHVLNAAYINDIDGLDWLYQRSNTLNPDFVSNRFSPEVYRFLSGIHPISIEKNYQIPITFRSLVYIVKSHNENWVDECLEKYEKKEELSKKEISALETIIEDVTFIIELPILTKLMSVIPDTIKMDCLLKACVETNFDLISKMLTIPAIHDFVITNSQTKEKLINCLRDHVAPGATAYPIGFIENAVIQLINRHLDCSLTLRQA